MTITGGRHGTEGIPGQDPIGTCSWTDPTLVKSDLFYPEEKMTAEERLAFYAARFSIVEVDSTYYSPPAEKTSGLWVERTPADFVFDIKAFRLLTQHPTPPASLWKEFREELPAEIAEKHNIYMRDLPRELQAEAMKMFRQGLMPLHSAGKLGVVLFQMPPFVYPTRGSFGYLKWAAEHLEDFQIAVEFRNGRWLDEEHMDETLDFLERHNLAYVCVDEPQGFKSSVPPVVAATARSPKSDFTDATPRIGRRRASLPPSDFDTNIRRKRCRNGCRGSRRWPIRRTRSMR